MIVDILFQILGDYAFSKIFSGTVRVRVLHSDTLAPIPDVKVRTLSTPDSLFAITNGRGTFTYQREGADGFTLQKEGFLNCQITKAWASTQRGSISLRLVPNQRKGDAYEASYQQEQASLDHGPTG